MSRSAFRSTCGELSLLLPGTERLHEPGRSPFVPHNSGHPPSRAHTQDKTFFHRTRLLLHFARRFFVLLADPYLFLRVFRASSVRTFNASRQTELRPAIVDVNSRLSIPLGVPWSQSCVHAPWVLALRCASPYLHERDGQATARAKDTPFASSHQV